MQISDDIIKQFGINERKAQEHISKKSIADILDKMCKVSVRIQEKSQLYRNTEDNDVREDCLDIIISTLNRFSQMFRDVMIRISAEDKGNLGKDSTLRRCISEYKKQNISNSESANCFLDQLNLRNDFIHDYFNDENQILELETIIYNYSAEAELIANDIREYCQEKGYLDLVVDKSDKSV